MNFQSNFEQTSPDELEAQCQSLRSQITRLKAEQQTRENDLQQAQTLLEQIRLAAQNLIEQLVAVLLPDLSAQTLARLTVIFPNEPNLFAAQPDSSPEQLGLWQRIVAFLGGGNAKSSTEQPLEQRRILLRAVLWRLSAVPAGSGNYLDLFQNLLQQKQEFPRQQALVNSSEIAANQAGENVRAALESLTACENAIARRKRASSSDEDQDIFRHRDQSPFDSSVNTPIIFTDSTVFNSSSDDSESSSVSSGGDFSFGGGGDAAGGGAGGSWENYS